MQHSAGVIASPIDQQHVTLSQEPAQRRHAVAGAFASIDPQTGLITLSPDDGPATFTISVEVTDGTNTTTGSFQLFVINVAPTAMLTFDPGASFIVNTPFSVHIAFPYDPSPTDTAAGFTYSFDLNENGNFNDAGESGLTDATHDFTFATEGWHTILARITDKDGAYTDLTVQVWIDVG